MSFNHLKNKNISRREFIEKIARVGGFTGLYLMGGKKLVDEAIAKSFFIPGHLSGGVVAYSAWNETTELVSNSAVWLLESGAATNEIGVDNRTSPITGADLELSVSVGLDAAIGSPPSRLFDGTDIGTITQAASNIIANGTPTWTIILKVENATNIRTENKGVFSSANGVDYVWMGFEATGFKFQTYKDSGLILNAVCAAQPSVTGMLHIAIWGDATYTRAGYVEASAGLGANGQPIKWSDFPANNRVTVTATTTWQPGDFTLPVQVMAFLGGTLIGKCYYLLLSDTCLFDNAS